MHQIRISGASAAIEGSLATDEHPRDKPSPLILIANDQEWTARAVESILAASGYRVAHAYTAGEALQAASDADPDVVILDQQLPDFSGLEVCRRLRADPRFGASLPVIITTAGPSGRPQRLGAYAAGAWEFYGQPLDAEALLGKLDVYVAAYQQTRQLRSSALIDASTGLYSRLGLARRANELIAEARRRGRAVSCVVWSVWRGEPVERVDETITAFRANGRAADALGRLGDGEFAIVAPGTDADAAQKLSERIRDVLARASGRSSDHVRSTFLTTADPIQLASDGDQIIDHLVSSLAA
jgi:PleD family two-component response regulator